MKSLICFRHGKSDWNADYESDHNRPISNRGIKASVRMGRYLSRINQKPELVISSTALRARDTAEIAIRSGRWGSKLILEDKIYEGTVQTLFSIIKQQNDKHTNICIVGHEPSLSGLIEKCDNFKLPKFPTAAMARIDFDSIKWNEIDYEHGKKIWIKKPKTLNQ